MTHDVVDTEESAEEDRSDELVKVQLHQRNRLCNRTEYVVCVRGERHGKKCVHVT